MTSEHRKIPALLTSRSPAELEESCRQRDQSVQAAEKGKSSVFRGSEK